MRGIRLLLMMGCLAMSVLASCAEERSDSETQLREQRAALLQAQARNAERKSLEMRGQFKQADEATTPYGDIYRYPEKKE